MYGGEKISVHFVVSEKYVRRPYYKNFKIILQRGNTDKVEKCTSFKVWPLNRKWWHFNDVARKASTECFYLFLRKNWLFIELLKKDWKAWYDLACETLLGPSWQRIQSPSLRSREKWKTRYWNNNGKRPLVLPNVELKRHLALFFFCCRDIKSVKVLRQEELGMLCCTILCSFFSCSFTVFSMP